MGGEGKRPPGHFDDTPKGTRCPLGSGGAKRWEWVCYSRNLGAQVVDLRKENQGGE